MTGEEIVLDNVVGGEIIKIKHSLMKVVCEHALVQVGWGRILLKLFNVSLLSIRCQCKTASWHRSYSTT